MLAMRSIVWNQQKTSVFLVKNVFEIGVALYEALVQAIKVIEERRSRHSQPQPA